MCYDGRFGVGMEFYICGSVIFWFQFIEQFQKVKEATRSTAKGGGVTNGSVRDGNEATIPPPNIMTGTSPFSARSQMHGPSSISTGSAQEDDHVRNSNEANANSLLKGVSVAHQRSQSLSAVPPGGTITTESPKHGATAGKPDLIGQSPETQLKYENERLRLALAQR
jgi:hypothetical protein